MFERFKSRSTELERLDTGDYTPAEYARWQREMWYIHRFFGEARALRRTMLQDVANRKARSVSVLDVGAGSGELLRIAKAELGETETFLVGLEFNASAADAIRSSGLTAVEGDGMRLPFADRSFDYVICSLVIHHLDETQVVRMLSEMTRVASIGVYAIDLNREPLPYYAYKYLGPIFLQRFSVEDGSLSIMRAYKPEELLALASQAGLKDATVTKSKLNRLVLSAK